MKKRTPLQQQQTVFLLSAAAAVCFIYIHRLEAVYISIFLSLAGAFSPFLTRLIDQAWMKLAWLLGEIVPRILLSIIFYVVLTPIALLSRMFGQKDPLMLKNDHSSTFRDKSELIDKASFEKPW